jgi:hypothetical protein
VTQLAAAQHIFSSVSRAQSPARRGGYQTIFYTHAGLTRADVQAIEDRAIYDASGSCPVKWQCYQLPSGKIAVGRIAPIDELDEFGRGGNYMAQSLVFTAEQWNDLDCGPFGIQLGSAPFYRSLAQALAIGDQQTGDIAPLALDLPAPWVEAALDYVRRWPPDQALLLAQLARRAADQGQQRLALIGTAEQIFEALAVALLFVQPSERALCSFDSYARGCIWPREISFWALGFAEARAASAPAVVDAARRRVILDRAALAQPDAYERWVQRLLRGGDLDTFLAHQDWALGLDALIAGDPPAPGALQAIPEAFVQEFAQINQDAIRRRLLEALPSTLPQELGQALISHLIDQSPDLRDLLAHRHQPGGLHDLDKLAEIVHLLAREQQAELLAWLAKGRLRAPALLATLESTVGKPDSAWSRLKQRFFGQPYND